MVRFSVIIFFSLLFGISDAKKALAQNAEADSLRRIAQNTSDPFEKSKILNQISISLIPIDVGKAWAAAEESVSLARQSGNKLQLGWSLLSESICLQIEGENELAVSRFSEIFKLNKNLKDAALEAYTTNIKANQFRDEGYFDSAIYNYEKARVIMARVNDTQFIIFSHLELTRHFLILNENERAKREIDAALALINKNPSITFLREAYLLLGTVLLQQFNYTEAEKYLKKAEEITEKNSTSFLRIIAARGDIIFQQGDFPAAIEIWKSILDAEKQIGYKYDLAMLLLKIAEAYSEQGFRKIAVEYLNTCLEISTKSGFDFIKSEAWFELAWVAYRTGDFKSATEKVKASEVHPKKVGLSIWVAACNNLRGLIYMGRKMYDSSLYFHKVALDARTKSGRQIAISSSLFNIGELYVNRKEYNKALNLLQQGVKIDESIQDNYGRSLYYYQLSKAFAGLNETDSVKFYLMKSIGLAVPNSAYEILQKSYIDLAKLLQKNGETDEAIRYLEKYIIIGDSLYNKQTAQTLAAYETLFELDKKEKAIELLNKDKELAEANSRNQLLFLYVLITGLIFLIFLALFYKRTGAKMKILNKSNEQKAKELEGTNLTLQKLYTELQGNHDELKKTIEKLEQAQDQLLKSEKMASLGILAAGVAHELNNPLNYIKGGVTTLEIQASREGRKESPDFNNSLSIIHEGINRASAILKGLGQYSRQSEKMTESCDLNKILDNCLVILSNSLKYHVKVIRSFSSESLIISGNEGKLHQAFINIIANAEQAITGEGTISISTKSTEKAIEVTISDTGCGISKENLKQLGNLFFTTKEPGKGTGLGLSISYKIIQEHGGKIHVESELGKGTIFTMTFSKS